MHEKTLANVRRQMTVEVEGQTDIVTMGLPYVGPYNVNAIMNPVLVACVGLGYFFRLVDIVHDRLGAATRQLTHEMTHGRHPTDVAAEARSLAADLGILAGRTDTPPVLREELTDFARRAEALEAVGVPPRGHQFRASAQILLHRDDVGRNAFAAPDGGGVDIQVESAGEAAR